MIIAEYSLDDFSSFVGDCSLSCGCTVAELPFKGEDAVLEDSTAVRTTVCKIAVKGGVVLESEVAFAVLYSAVPLAFVEICSFLSPIAVHFIIAPSAFVDPSIDEVEDALAVLPVVPHVSLVSLSIFRDENALARCFVVLPLPQINVSIIALEDACPVFLSVFQLTLVGFSGWIFDLLDIFEELRVVSVDVVLKEAFDDALLLFFQALRVDGLHGSQDHKIIQMIQRMQLPSHMRHCISSENSAFSSRQVWQSRHPHLMGLQSLNFMQFTQPITRMIEGAVSISSWLSILCPSPQIGALAEMSSSVQVPLTSQLAHSMMPRLITPLQKVSLCCFLQALHRNLRDTLMGETALWMILLLSNSFSVQMGLPSITDSVEILNLCPQFSSECPSRVKMRMQSLVRRTKAILSIRVQNSSGGRLSLFSYPGSLNMTL